MATLRAHVFILGLVQGVFFRDWTLRQAQGKQLTGWVKNLFDGRVEAVFEGKEEKVREMVKICHQGPPAAIVEKVEVEWEEATQEFPSFKILYG